MTKTSNDQYIDDELDSDLQTFTAGALLSLKQRGFSPLECVEIITKSRPSMDSAQCSWSVAEKLIFLELRRQIFISLFDEPIPF